MSGWRGGAEVVPELWCQQPYDRLQGGFLRARRWLEGVGSATARRWRFEAWHHHLPVSDEHCVLTDVYYIPQLRSSIVIIGQLDEHGWEV